MAHSPRKQLSSYLRDWGVDRADEPELVNAIFPVSIVDAAGEEFLCRYRPMFTARGAMAATAAVHSLIGLQCVGRPIKVTRMVPLIQAASDVQMLYSTVDLRTANQTVETTNITSYLRGQTQQALVLEGTTTVTPTGYVLYEDTDDVYFLPGLQNNPLWLRPGEFLWLANATVNIALFGQFQWTEYAVISQPDPPNLR